MTYLIVMYLLWSAPLIFVGACLLVLARSLDRMGKRNASGDEEDADIAERWYDELDSPAMTTWIPGHP